MIVDIVLVTDVLLRRMPIAEEAITVVALGTTLVTFGAVEMVTLENVEMFAGFVSVAFSSETDDGNRVDSVDDLMTIFRAAFETPVAIIAAVVGRRGVVGNVLLLPLSREFAVPFNCGDIDSNRAADAVVDGDRVVCNPKRFDSSAIARRLFCSASDICTLLMRPSGSQHGSALTVALSSCSAFMLTGDPNNEGNVG